MDPQNDRLGSDQNQYILATEGDSGAMDSPEPLSNLPADALSQQAVIEETPMGSVRPGPANLLRFNKWALLFSISTLVLVAGVGVVTLSLVNRHTNNQLNSAVQQPADEYGVKGLPLTAVNPAGQLSSITGASSVAINGQLQVGNTFVLTPTATPSLPKIGQIYFNKDTNTPFVYDGTGFKSLTGVESLGGATGSVAVGGGLQLINNQLSLSSQSLAALQQQTTSAVRSLQSTTPLISLSENGGVYTLATRGILSGVGTTGVISMFTAGGVIGNSVLQQSGNTVLLGGDMQVSGQMQSGSLTTGVLVAGSIQTNAITGSGTADVNISAGNKQVVFTSGDKTFQFPASGSANQTICTVGMDCSTGSGGAYVVLDPSAAQIDSGTGTSIFVNNTGGGSLLSLQSGGSDKLTVANNGNTTVTGNFVSTGTINGATISGGNISGGTINGATISGGSITGGSLTAVSVNGLGLTTTAITASGAFNIAAGNNQNLNLNTSGTGIITLGTAVLQGTGALSISAGGTNQSLNLKGTGTGNVVIQTPVFHNANGATYAFDTADAGAAVGTICTTLGNCTGASGGGVASTGTTGYLPVFGIDGYHLGNSMVSQDSGATLTTIHGALAVNGAINNATITGGSLTSTAVNGLSVNGSAVAGAGALSVTAGGTNQNLTLAGSGTGNVIIQSPVFHNANGATYSFSSSDTSATNATICTSAGNCTGSAGGGVASSGTSNYVALFGSDGYHLSNSMIQQNAGGTVLTVTGALTVTGTINNATISGGSLSATAVNGLGVASGAITGTGALSVTAGGTNQNLTLGGSGTGGVIIQTPTFHNANGATYSFSSADTGSTNATICTNTGNCIGSPGGGVSSSGSSSYIAAYGADGYHLVDSMLQQNAGGTVLTINGATLNASGALSISAGGTNQDLSLSGSGTGNVVVQNPVFHNANGATYNFNATDTSGTTATVCTSAGNCTGSAGGGIVSSGSSNYVALFGADGYHLGNSIVSQSGAVVSVGGQLTASNGIAIIGNSTVSGTLTGLTGFASSGTVTLSGLTTVGVVHNTAAGALSTGLITNGDLQGGAYSAITGTGALQSGSLATGFGPINITSAITTSGTVTGQNVVGNTGVNTGAGAGTQRIDANGALQNITGYNQASGNFAQNGTGTFSTGTGAVNLNGATTLGSTLNVSGATTLQGNLTLNGTQLTNNGATLNTALALGNFASGGSIGLASATVDSRTSIAIAQTTAGQILTLPSPTTTTAGRVLYIMNSGTAAFTMGGVTVPAGYGQIFVWNGSAWILGANGGGSSITLQGAYDGGNAINTTDARNISFGLADTTTDANFIINIASASTGQFKIQKAGTDVLSVGNSGQLGLAVQGASGGLAIGGDTLAYRSGANRLQMNNALTLRNTTDTATALQIQNAAGTDVVTVDTANKSLSVGAPLTYNAITYPVSFGSYSSYKSGSNYLVEVVAADFNGDGKIDTAAVSSNSGSGPVTVNFGNGDGTLQTYRTYYTNAYAQTLATGDFNGDGKPDLVTKHESTDVVSVLLNKGDGTFQAAVDYATGDYPYSVAIADFNGDGKLDLVVADYYSNTASILLGNGDGTFQPKVDYATNSNPRDVTTGDFNGDGKVDLAVTSSANTASILLGNGDGTFQPKVDYATNSDPQGITTGDFNNDGRLDLAVVAANTASILLGNGDGTFQPKVDYTSGGGGEVTTGDFNGDGKVDLAVTSSITTASILLGNGDGTFQPKVDYTSGSYLQGITTGDFNGDGKVDLAVTDVYASNIDILLNTSAIGAQTVAGTLNARANNASSTALLLQGANGQAVDILHVQNSAQTTLFGISQNGRVGIGNIINLDSSSSLLNVAGSAQFNATSGYTGNLLDLQIGGVSKFKVDQSGNTTVTGTLAVSGPARSFTALSYSAGSGFGTAAGSPTGAAPYDVKTADFNKDGKRDAVTANSSGNSVSVLLGNGDGTLGTKTDYTVGTDPVRVRVADVNKDGNMDIITADRAGSKVSVILGNGDGTFQPAVNYTTGHFPSALDIADINGDGKLDIVTVGYAGGASSEYVTKLLGNGDGTFQAETSIQTLTDAAAYSGVYGYMNVTDLNGDGKPDLSFGQSSDSVAGYQWIAFGNGDGTFQAAIKLSASGYSAHAAAVTDLNGDGKVDIAFGSGTTVYIFLGNGNGTFQAPTTYTAQANISSIAAADINGDGITDLTTGSNSTAQVLVALGNGNGTFQAPTTYSLAGVSFSLVAADLTGDGKPEILSVNRNATGMVYVFINGGSVTKNTVTATTSITTSNSGTAGIVLQASSGQTADLMRLQDASANAMLEVAANGKVGVGNFSNLANSSYLLNVAGNIQVNTLDGFIGNLLNLQVDGVSELRVDQSGNLTLAGTLTVAGAVNLRSSLTVSGATTVATITINGHIVSGGNTPTATALAGNCDGAGTVTITGNDTAGIITLTTGAAATCAPTTYADAVSVTYASAYNKKPVVMLTPASLSDIVNGGSASGLYLDDAASSATGFMLAAAQAAGATQVWYYHVIQ